MRIDAQHLGRQLRPADKGRSPGGGTLASGGDDLRADQGVDQGAFSHARPPHHGHHQRPLQPAAQRPGPLQQPPDQRPARLGRLPSGRIVGPAFQPLAERVDLTEQLQMGQFGACHTSRIADNRHPTVGDSQFRTYDFGFTPHPPIINPRNSPEKCPGELFPSGRIRYAEHMGRRGREVT